MPPKYLTVQTVDGYPASRGKHYVVSLPYSARLDNRDDSWGWVKGDGYGQRGFWTTRSRAVARLLAATHGIEFAPKG